MRSAVGLLVALAIVGATRSAFADEAAPPPKPRPSVALRVDGAFAPRRLLGLDVSGGSAGLGVGARFARQAAAWGAARVSLGSTENGLAIRSASIGPEIELILQPVRFAFGAYASAIGVERVTRNKMILGYGPMGAFAVRVDVVDTDGFALFARAAIDVGVELGNGSVFWGPTLGAGFDFDVVGRRPDR